MTELFALAALWLGLALLATLLSNPPPQPSPTRGEGALRNNGLLGSPSPA